MSKVLEALTDDNYNPIIKNNFINNRCSHCGECCGACPMPLTRKEEKRIRAYIKKHNILYQPSHKWLGPNGEHNEELRCCFYDIKNRICTIYEVRPEICRSFRCNMSQEAIELNKVVQSKRAYWNHIDANSNKPLHLTNFSLLFYGRYYDLIKWFQANLRGRLPDDKLIDFIFHILEEGGINIDANFMQKIEKEVKENNDYWNNL